MIGHARPRHGPDEAGYLPDVDDIGIGDHALRLSGALGIAGDATRGALGIAGDATRGSLGLCPATFPRPVTLVSRRVRGR